MSGAITTQGFKFEIGNADSPLTYTEVKEITNFQGFDGQAAEIDVTHLQSTAKEYILGLQDFGSLSLDVNYLTGDAGQDLMRAAKAAGTIQDFRMTLSNMTTAVFRGYVQSAPLNGGVDAKVDGSYSIRITGAVTGTAV
jgi:hypothetical protein